MLEAGSALAEDVTTRRVQKAWFGVKRGSLLTSYKLLRPLKAGVNAITSGCQRSTFAANLPPIPVFGRISGLHGFTRVKRKPAPKPKKLPNRLLFGAKAKRILSAHSL